MKIISTGVLTISAIVVAALVALVLFLHNGQENLDEKASAEIVSVSKSISATQPESRLSRKKEKLVVDGKMLAHHLRRHSDIDVEEDPETISVLTDEEHSHRAKLFKKLEKVYFEMAPEILEEMLESEQKDMDWKANVNYLINNLIKDDRISGAELVNIDCRTTLCKAKVELPSKNQFSDFRDLWATIGPPSGRDFGSQREIGDGRIEMTVYFTREEVVQPFIELEERMAAKADEQNL